MNIGIPQIKNEEVKNFLEKIKTAATNRLESENKNLESREKKQKDILLYLENEKNALERIKKLLSDGRDKEQTQENFELELENLISEREYLFLHFPDGYKCDTKNTSFLKRVRSELDFFLKDIKNAAEDLRENK